MAEKTIQRRDFIKYSAIVLIGGCLMPSKTESLQEQISRREKEGSPLKWNDFDLEATCLPAEWSELGEQNVDVSNIHISEKIKSSHYMCENSVYGDHLHLFLNPLDAENLAKKLSYWKQKRGK